MADQARITALPKLLRIPEAAQQLGVSERTVYYMIKAGELKAIKVRSKWRIPAEELDRYIERQAEAA